MPYLIEVPEAPDQQNRYVNYPGGVYAGPKSTIFVNLAGACKSDGKGGWTGKANFDVAQRIVDDFRTLVAEGHPDKWLASIRVTTFNREPKLREVVYPRAVEAVAVEPELPAVMEASDGAWRVVPQTNFKKTPRGWTWSFAFVDSQGIPRADSIPGPTKLGIVERVFEKGFVVFEELTRTFPLADPTQIPAPPAPTVEYVPTTADIAAVLPITVVEF